MNFNYFHEERWNESLEVDDIGNCTLQANNDNLDEWYLNIKTELGWSVIQQFGPLTIDSDDIGYSFNYSYYKFEFNEKKLHSIIYDFLNNNKREITQAQELDSDIFNERLSNIQK